MINKLLIVTHTISNKILLYNIATLYYDAPLSLVVDDEDPKSYSKIAQNFLYCSLGYVYKHIGTPKFWTKVHWV